MIAIITGASSGIGREFAYQVDELDFDEIWLVARSLDRLETLKNRLKKKVRLLNYDLTKDDSFQALGKILARENPQIGLLVNSAGLGFNDYFSNISLDDEDGLIKLNIIAINKLIKISLPFMARPSTIINIASVAGFIPQPKFASYAASKAYVISLSRALNREFKKREIQVTALCPNPVDTEFANPSQGGIKSIGKEDLSKLVKTALKKAGYKDLITVHPASKFMLIISKIIPHSFIMWVEKILKLY